jgi:ATP-dependent Clp protease ATP-binding subunit ClpX
MLDMDGVDLQFTEGALRAIARLAVQRGSGARGLRSILERVMLDVMFEIPGEENIKEVVVNEEAVLQGTCPLVVLGEDAKSA